MDNGWSRSSQKAENIHSISSQNKAHSQDFIPPLNAEQENELFGEFLYKKTSVELPSTVTPKEKNVNIIWIEGAGCGGEWQSFLSAGKFDNINWIYCDGATVQQGDDAYSRIVTTVKAKREFILIVSGAVPIANNGNSIIAARHHGRTVSAQELIIRLALDAQTVIALGTCACYGGLSAAAVNSNECLPLRKIINNKNLITMYGCPVEPWALKMLFTALNDKLIIETDKLGVPLFYSGKTLHQSCGKRADFEKGNFAKKIGQSGCMFQLGCKGSVCKCCCGEFQPNCISCGGLCIGCCNENFPNGTGVKK